MPAHERFGADHPPGAQIDFRLIQQAELVAFDRSGALAGLARAA